MTRVIASLLVLLALPVRGQDVDGGTSGSTSAFTLYQDYGCPEAGPWQQIDGGWLASDARKERINCALNGAQGELDTWRGKKPAPLPDPGFSFRTEHWIITIVSALISMEIGTIATRSGQHCKAVANPFASCH